MVDDHAFYNVNFQIGDLKGLFGLLMVSVQKLRSKMKILDLSYGEGAGLLLNNNFLRKLNILFYINDLPGVVVFFRKYNTCHFT